MEADGYYPSSRLQNDKLQSTKSNAVSSLNLTDGQATRTPLKQKLIWRERIDQVPHDKPFELPGRPTVVYQLESFCAPNGAKTCRKLVPFLFKSFETGQTPPPRMKDRGKIQRYQATIHEYLDWTVTACHPESEMEPDFSGFRVLLLQPRFRPTYPPPEEYIIRSTFIPTPFGAPLPPIPDLFVDHSQSPIAAATIRTGSNFLEIPFFATSHGKRSKGYGRVLLEAIEDIAHGIGIKLLVLCSTEDAKPFWKHVGFQFTKEEDWKIMGVKRADLLHMDNTVQMHKWLGVKRKWKSIIIRHGTFAQRLYYPDDQR